ncbi:MAG TPA: heavy metal-binding domain-containing protein [Polyangiaceae bacterium]|jgi:uncharacterized protein YbjQ (UPF0145 family)
MAQPPYQPPYQQPPYQQPPHARDQQIPAHAHERLTAMRQRKFFTSDLSVNEFLLVKEAGFEPLGLVMGSSIYSIGAQQIGQQQPGEVTPLTQALYQSRELAMERMEAEADELGADGIVAMRLTMSVHAWGTNIVEFLAIGTAVRHAASQGAYRTHDGKPFTSDLSGQDFWTILNAGYRPLGFVMGNCVYYVGPPVQQAMNGELAGPTQALYDARELAMERMQFEAESLRAEGIVGVTVDESNHTWGPTVLEFSAVGTAVVAIRADHQIPRPTLVLTVNG